MKVSVRCPHCQKERELKSKPSTLSKKYVTVYCDNCGDEFEIELPKVKSNE